MDRVGSQVVGESDPSLQRPVVVIDVMRAFTTAAWAFARETERIVLARSEADARNVKRRHPDWPAVKDGAPAPGFELVNSPAMMSGQDLAGRTLIQTTTSGTAGAHQAATAPLLLCASFVVAGATARFLRSRGISQVTYLATGDDGRADEDRACAEYIERCLHQDETDVGPFLRRGRASRAAAELAEGVRRGYRGIHPDDVEFCLDADRFSFAMTAAHEGPLLVLRPVRMA
ncbi:2-phosphosulfolactate phosphatase [Streptomyces aurantiacus]|uniref:2-phosphosulfolactate phosphatase n=1 Tax=Streptomyces aurantiacus TaxID=47760 RepID=UPI00279196D4|nr:2-phosphosulfolactate phosphatase [Streptomyces aurantiacus]MDQ0773923.1 2-phosphosulfolactate phosphatase [Streptomyces aurantiacus]